MLCAAGACCEGGAAAEAAGASSVNVVGDVCAAVIIDRAAVAIDLTLVAVFAAIAVCGSHAIAVRLALCCRPAGALRPSPAESQVLRARRPRKLSVTLAYHCGGTPRDWSSRAVARTRRAAGPVRRASAELNCESSAAKSNTAVPSAPNNISSTSSNEAVAIMVALLTQCVRAPRLLPPASYVCCLNWYDDDSYLIICEAPYTTGAGAIRAA